MAGSMSERQAYRKSRKLAEELDCYIEIERRGSGSDLLLTYWVYGPPEVYYLEDYSGRVDPCEGTHACAGWYEVLATLETYQVDLYLHSLGITDEQTFELDTTPDPLHLGYTWLSSRDVADGLVYCDWLEEQGNPLADAIRKGLMATGVTGT